ncbi:MAG TPA: BrnT family toxin [Acidobacteriaceae bacterium]|jgi:hypothetical protein|nr:BrnT family toxin [Acidobacteriaceae bacterium]
MDTVFLYQGQRFAWDTEKAVLNLLKHAIAFEKACEVFFDPFVRLVDASDREEVREAVLGLTEDMALLFVVHVFREGDTIRIISARLATSQERKAYEEDD